MNTIKFSNQFFKKGKKFYLIAFLFLFISCLASIALPQIANIIIDFVFNYTPISYQKVGIFGIFIGGFWGEPQSVNLFVSLLCLLACFAVFKCFGKFLSAYLFNYSGTFLSGNARKSAFQKLTRCPSISSSGNLYITFTNDINNMRDANIIHLPSICENVFIAVVGIIFTFNINVLIGVLICVSLPFIVLLENIYLKTTARAIASARQTEGELNYFLKKTTEAMVEINLNKTTNDCVENFTIVNDKFYNSKINVYKKTNKYYLYINLIKSLTYAFAIILAGVLVFDNVISVGGFVAVLAYVVITLESLIICIGSIFSFIESNVNAKSFVQFLKSPNKIDYTGNKIVNNNCPNFEIKNLTMNFGDLKVFSNFSLNAQYGQKIGVFSLQGEGKTVLMRTILGMLYESSGEILLDDDNIKNYDINSYRKCFSYVSEEPIIFDGTIKGNIEFYSKKDNKKYNQIINGLQLCDYIGKQANKAISQDAVIPSQEKQLINIARGLFRNAPILLLDSVFKNFNMEKTNQILDFIFELYKDKTIIMTSMNAETLKKCDTIIVVRNGKIVEHGSPSELLEKEKFYYNALVNKE